MFWLLTILAFAAYCFLGRQRAVPKLHGLYGQRMPGDIGYLIKVAVFTAALMFSKFRNVYIRRKDPKAELKRLKIRRATLSHNDEVSMTFVGSDSDGKMVYARLRRLPGRFAQVSLIVRLNEGLVLTHPNNGVQVVDETEDNEDSIISAGGLRIQAIDEVRKFRLLYSGALKQKDGDFMEVNLRLWFRCLDDPASHELDGLSPFQRAKELANDDLPLLALVPLLQPQFGNNFEQSGELIGKLEFSGHSHDLDLNGVRQFTIGKTEQLCPDQGFFKMVARFDRGLVFSINAASFSKGPTHTMTGLLHTQPCFVYPTVWSDLHLASFSTQLQRSIDINLKNEGRLYSIHLDYLDQVPASENARNFIFRAILNDDQDLGFAFIRYNYKGEHLETNAQNQCIPAIVKSLPSLVQTSKVPNIISLSDSICRNEALSGGKAAKIADILAVLKHEQSELISVPEGLVVSSEAYQQHLKAHPKLADSIRNLLKQISALNIIPSESEQYSVALERVQSACDEINEQFMQSNLTEAFAEELKQGLASVFGSSWDEIHTAVRSSAVGEDGTEASGAGQMETFLGRKGFDRIIEAIKLCWASHYAFRALQYRRQFCAKLDSPMAVLIQRLVKADVAGVLFTRHPDTGSTARAVINAAYGIGEGVVSGQVQPDTISVLRLDPNSSDLTIHHDFLGSKAGAFKLNETSGQVEFQAGKADDSSCCLTEQEIRKLYEAGRYLEQIFGSGRDVEFALTKQDGRIHILQARPITTSDLEAEWELLQEFDGPIASKHEWITTANVQEMMPGAMSPLSFRIWMDMVGLDESQARILLKPQMRHKIRRMILALRQHVFFNWTVAGAAIIDEARKRTWDMAMFARHVEEMKGPDFIEQNHMESWWFQLYFKFLEQLGNFLPNNRMKKLEPIVENFKDNHPSDPVTLFRQIQEEILPLCQQTWTEHIDITVQAAMAPMVLMLTLDSSLNWGPQIYEDMALLLSNCDVLTGQVPRLLESIAQSIRDDKAALDFFSTKDRSTIAKWLLSDDSGSHGRLFKDFLEKHGHRCVRDSDIRETSWAQEPEKVVDALKVMVTTNPDSTKHPSTKRELSEEEAIAAIKTPVSKMGRRIIKFFLPKARAAVGKREWAKSLGIKATDHVRRAYFKLAEQLTIAGYVPDRDLIYFMTPDEIGQLLQRRSPKSIAKALRRRKLFPKFTNLQWPELVQGRPEPLNAHNQIQAVNGSLTIKGMAVGSGSIEGTARVVTSLAEANQIQNGDILIVPYTDVGWTPYFPLMGGLVTELGGMISHGAVVAREYGLPCLVGCKMATQLIKTGDHVYLDGHMGQIRVLE